LDHSACICCEVSGIAEALIFSDDFDVATDSSVSSISSPTGMCNLLDVSEEKVSMVHVLALLKFLGADMA
jgi:hypothetical protein